MKLLIGALVAAVVIGATAYYFTRPEPKTFGQEVEDVERAQRSIDKARETIKEITPTPAR